MARSGGAKPGDNGSARELPLARAAAAAPPVSEADDLGFDGEWDPGPADGGIDDGVDSSVDPEASGAARPDPRSFAEVVALAGARRDMRLKVHLEEHISIVKFDATAGSIDLFLLPGAPPQIVSASACSATR